MLSLVALAACDGNPFPAGSPGGNPDDDGKPPANNQPVVVPAELKDRVQKVIYTPATGSAPAQLQVQIVGLDTTPVLATWDRNPALDLPGYTAFSMQEDALDRMFIGLSKTSANGAVTATVAGSTHYNIFIAGTTYARNGAFTPPKATGGGPATGQVSYAGKYAGMLNVGNRAGSELITPPAGTPPVLQPGQPVRVQGNAFVNANFADNTVEGAIYNRVVADTGFGLESVVLAQDGITANGTFEGETRRPTAEGAPNETNGIYAGVFGGKDAGGVAGAISLDGVYNRAGDQLEDVTERGIFVLNQCGLPGLPVAPNCAGTAP